MNKVLLSNYSRSKTDVEKRNSAKKKKKKKKNTEPYERGQNPAEKYGN